MTLEVMTSLFPPILYNVSTMVKIAVLYRIFQPTVQSLATICIKTRHLLSIRQVY